MIEREGERESLNYLTRRVAKLECSSLFTTPTPILDRFATALEEAAHRLTGRSFESIKNDSAAQDRIADDVANGFYCRLGHADQRHLTAELERIAAVQVMPKLERDLVQNPRQSFCDF